MAYCDLESEILVYAVGHSLANSTSTTSQEHDDWATRPAASRFTGNDQQPVLRCFTAQAYSLLTIPPLPKDSGAVVSRRKLRGGA